MSDDRPTRPISAEEEAVVKAAKVFVKAVPAPSLLAFNNAEFADLYEAVRALPAPKGVSPEDVEPGTRFRFADAHETAVRGIMMFDGDNPDIRMFRWETPGKGVFRFPPDARIIPTEQD